MRQVGDHRFDDDFGIDLPQLVGGGNCLRQAVGDILFVVENLPLQIVELEKVAVDESQ